MAERLPVILFDLGGVLTQFTGFEEIQPMLARPMSIAEIAAEWNFSAAIKDFRIGAIRPREFAERFVAEWQLTVTPDVFLGAFRLWIHDFCPSTRALLTELRELGYRVACISETNEVHWARLVNEFGLTSLFDEALSSHVFVFRKHDPAAYVLAARVLSVDPRHVVYFDDSAMNVFAARRAGFRAFRVNGVQEVRRSLRDIGVLRG